MALWLQCYSAKVLNGYSFRPCPTIMRTPKGEAVLNSPCRGLGGSPVLFSSLIAYRQSQIANCSPLPSPKGEAVVSSPLRGLGGSPCIILFFFTNQLFQVIFVPRSRCLVFLLKLPIANLKSINSSLLLLRASSFQLPYPYTSCDRSKRFRFLG